MAKISITAETARRIVEVGTESVYTNTQGFSKPLRGRQAYGHYVGRTKTQISGTSGSGSVTDILDLSSTSQNEIILLEDVKCPLLGSNGSIAAGTVVVVSRNIQTGEWQIIEMACP